MPYHRVTWGYGGGDRAVSVLGMTVVPEIDSTQAAVEHLGRAIVLGRVFRPGDTLTIETIEKSLNVSRAMAREALQLLHALRLVNLRPRRGATVLPLHEWNVLHPDVIEWRLASASSDRLWKSLTQLRQAVEPAAARLAADRAPADVCRDLVTLADELRELGGRDRFDEAVRVRYREVDARFHRAVLAGSLNEMYISLTGPVEKVLNHRIDQQFATLGTTARSFPKNPEPVALWLHVFLAQAIDRGKARAAYYFSRGILAETLGELRTDVDLERGLPESLDDVAVPAADREAFSRDLDRALTILA